MCEAKKRQQLEAEKDDETLKGDKVYQERGGNSPTHGSQRGVDREAVDVPGEDRRREGDSSENPKRCLEKGQSKGLRAALFVAG
jgi:hypothetical protein